MAKSRRTRRGSRKSHRKTQYRKRKTSHRKSQRKSRGGGFFGKIYSPVSHLLQATENAVGTVTGSVNSVAKTGIRGINRIGKSVTGHANSAVRNLVSRKRKSRRNNRK
jgi:hypothetical protein